jgi:hypothetical protein
MQDVADTHATDSSADSSAPDGAGGDSAFQIVPFHDSASGRSTPAEFWKKPTATHAVVVAQATPDNRATVVPDGSGTGFTAHDVRVHSSASPVYESEVLPAPTAMHSALDRQATPLRTSPGEPVASGVEMIAQLVPFHDSPSVMSARCPTDVHAVADEQDTPSNEFAGRPCGFGVAAVRAQAVPLNDSAKLTCSPTLSVSPPTEMQLVAALHVTPLSDVPVPAGSGVTTTDQAFPFQDIASVEAKSPAPPTAMQAAAALQAIAARS